MGKNTKKQRRVLGLRASIIALYGECKQQGCINKHSKQFIQLIQRLPGFKDNFVVLKAFSYLKKHQLEKFQKFVWKTESENTNMLAFMTGKIGTIHNVNFIESI